MAHGPQKTTEKQAMLPLPLLSWRSLTASILLFSSSFLFDHALSMSSSSSNSSSMRFGRFVIPSSHIFYRSPLSAAFVNLRPIVTGHVLVIPQRIVPTLEELSEEEYVDLWKSVRKVQAVLKQHSALQHDAGTTGTITAFNIAVQDGQAAGQSVPHAHVHILPRVQGDFDRNDDIYDALEAWAPRPEMKRQEQEPHQQKLNVPDDKDRVDRTSEMMEEEAAAYRTLFDSNNKL
jgi:bis(5'-adenosyl)-triphosphatase